MITPAAAEAAIRARAALLETESRPLAGLAAAVLREPISASRDQPPFDRVTMDGIAFASGSGRRDFRIAGTQAAGARQLVLASQDACFEVMTGAVTPTGCDCVVPVERIAIQGGVATLQPEVVVTQWLNIHRRGIDCRAGTKLLEPGIRLGPSEVAVIASTGLAHVQVSREPRIMVISTGDELIEPGEPVTDWQIYRSNAFAVLTTLRQRGYTQLAQDHLPDDLETLRTRLRAHLDTHDVLILSGGVSMGKYDYVPRVLAELGVTPVFHNVAQRPGKPMWFGVGTGTSTVYALPGNPVSTLMCLRRYVLPGLAASMGVTPASDDTLAQPIALGETFEVKPALTLFVPVRVVADSAGHGRAQPRLTQGSGDFTSLLRTDGFVQLPPGPAAVPQGGLVPLYRW